MVPVLTKGWIITDVVGGKTFYYKKWAGASCAGRPKWTEKFSLKCIYARKADAQKIVDDSYQQLNASDMQIQEIGVSLI